ncbi:MAG: outer membrane protein assembly factor BamA [Desulfobacterales bacterium]
MGIMLKRFFWVLVAAISVLPVTVLAARKPVNVLILPFEVNAAQDLAYLKTEIPKVIGQNLTQEGATVLSPPEAFVSPTGIPDLSPANIRRTGEESGANFVLWGSMTMIGQQFSLDVRLLEVFNPNPPKVFSIVGQGLENLPLKVKELVSDILVVIFEQKNILTIRIEGNKRIEADAIRKIIKTAPGDIYSVKNLSDDLKAIYGMGYFDDVRVEAEDEPDGKVVVFQVKEKPTIRYIRFEGNRVFDDKEMKENITLKTGSILNIFQIQNNVQRIEGLYKDKNYHNVKVAYKIQEEPNNQADVTFTIEEGKKVRIEHIFFVGNKAFTDKQLKKQMGTSEKGFFSFITDSGDLKKEDLDQDVSRLEAFYQNQGYIRAKVGEPQIEYKEDGIDVTIKIEEGPQFKVGTIDVKGDLIFPREVLLDKIKLRKEEFYNRTVLRDDLLALSDLYSDEGYAFADITPLIDENAETLVVNITYQFDKGQQVYFEEITISGNSKTRDKVIRRQLEVYEQGLYSGSRLKRSIRNLNRLDYFQDVKVNTTKGSADDKMLLNIDVEEKSTGQFSVGGGYSNTEKVFFVGSISQRNLFGRGQILSLAAEVGTVNQRYQLSFTEPWLFDIPLSAGFRIYDWTTEYDAYDKTSIGASIFFGYPIFRDTRLSTSFTYDRAKLDITDFEATPVSILSLFEQFGNSPITTLSVLASINYDTRDRIFSPTNGADHRFSVEYAGLGGDVGFTKYIAQVSWYVPIIRKLVGHARVKGGYVTENSAGVLPDYELFYMGGFDSIIGYDRDEIQPKDLRGDPIGGDKFAFANLELIHPLLPSFGLDGFVFFDIGAITSSQPGAEPQNFDSDSLRKSVGVGALWNSPMGAIGLAYGFKLDKKEGESDGAFEFNIGGAF